MDCRKIRSWCDCEGNVEHKFEGRAAHNIGLLDDADDRVLVRIYTRVASGLTTDSRRVTVPMACAIFQGHRLFDSAGQAQNNLTRWTEMPLAVIRRDGRASCWQTISAFSARSGKLG